MSDLFGILNPPTTMSDHPIELKPCPFCGGRGRAKGLPKREHDTLAFMAVECQSCGAMGPVSSGCSTEKVGGKWNERHVPCATDVSICIHHHREEVDELRERLTNLIAEFRNVAPVVRRLVRYADRVAERHPEAVTVPGQNARVAGGLWLAKFDPERKQPTA